LRAAQGERCTARFTPARALDELVWQDLCRILREPALITHALARAHGGAWLPQALQARRKTLRDALIQLERQQARLLEVYLAEIIGRDEFERTRQEVTQTQHGLTQPLRQLAAQAQQQVDIAALAQGLEAFCQRRPPTLNQLTFAQRRPLVELLIDHVIVTHDQVEIRYVVPTGPKGETTPFCHVRLDYLDLPALAVPRGEVGNTGALRVEERGRQGDLAGPEARRADMAAHLSEHSCRWQGRQRFPGEPRGTGLRCKPGHGGGMDASRGEPARACDAFDRRRPPDTRHDQGPTRREIHHLPKE
jgi:hypothetical protein